MQIILLAAGTSSRLKPISDKNLLHFCGKSLVQHQVERLQEINPEKIIIVGNKFNLAKLKLIFSNQNNIEFAEQSNLNNSQVDRVLAGAKKVSAEQVLIVSTNDIFEPRLLKEIMDHSNRGDGVIAGKQVSKYFPGGYLNINKAGFLTEIIEKPEEGSEPSDLVNMVVHLYNHFSAFTEKLNEINSENDGRYEAALDSYTKNGAQIKILKYNGFWQPIKYPWHVILVMNYFLKNIKRSIHSDAILADTAIINGEVVIEEGVKIMDYAVIQGPTYIGKNSVVANSSLVRNSMIGEGSVIGFNTEIARSYLNHEVWTHRNYIGDSVIDYNVSFGAGTVIGNLRFDESEIKMGVKGVRLKVGTHKFGAVIGNGVRFGTNSTTSPGVKVGKNTFVGANVLLEKDIDNRKIILADQSLKILKNEKKSDVKRRY